jgi:Mg-chelatase subunit ChlD
MNCPYCQELVYGMTGLQEATHFCRHLAGCRKNPNNLVMTDGVTTVVTPRKQQTLDDAVKIRADSGQ